MIDWGTGRQMGVPAPRAIHAKLYINGIYIGLFFVEQIDEQSQIIIFLMALEIFIKKYGH